MNEVEFKKYLEKLEHYCAYQERCISEVKLKMTKIKVPSEFTDNLINSLLENKFIDEERYVRAYVHSKVTYKRDGVEKIRYGLKHKGIRDNLINEVCAELDKISYQANLEALINKKKETLIAKYDKQETKTKLVRYLLSKGYRYDEFRNFISQ